MISELRPQHKLAVLLRVSGLARSTFYYQQHPCRGKDAYAHEKSRIKALFHHHRGRYGYRRITLALRREGCHLNHKTVRRLMREQQLASRLRHRKYQSYKGTYGRIAPDLLKRNFTADRPNQKWVTDVTEFNVGGKKLYLSPVLDLYNREIIAWNMEEHPGFNLVGKMLESAFGRLGNGDRPVLHSDQGWQYQMAVYQGKLRQHHLEPSMSRRGNCLDNAVMENFFGILKSECWYPSEFTDIQQLKSALNEYIHYYNNERIKLNLNALSPVQYRTQALSATK